MADGAAGHVLKNEGNRCLNGQGEIYVVFEDLEAARKFIEQKQDENDSCEFIIYKSNNECVEHLEARKGKR